MPRRLERRHRERSPLLTWTSLYLHVISGAAVAIPQRWTKQSGAGDNVLGVCPDSGHLVIGLTYFLIV